MSQGIRQEMIDMTEVHYRKRALIALKFAVINLLIGMIFCTYVWYAGFLSLLVSAFMFVRAYLYYTNSRRYALDFLERGIWR